MGELTTASTFRQVTRHDLELSRRAYHTLSLLEVPVLQRAEGSHDYLFFALFDGTGQDVDNPKQRPTNIGILKEQIDKLDNDPSHRIGFKYIEGIGTQPNPIIRALDAWVPQTWDDKLREAYTALANQTWEWQQQDPQATIQIVGVGYSRGAVLAVGLSRLVDRYGIADPESLSFGRDAQGQISVHSQRPPLVPPGQAAQALGLYDPVATHLPPSYDARAPASVVSALSLTAADERRLAFPHQVILEPGLSQGRRFANLLLPGGHANVGGGLPVHGLETLAFNQMADYLNGLRDRPLFTPRPLPDHPVVYAVYQARGLTAVPGLDPDEQRNLRTTLADCQAVDLCRQSEPMDPALAARYPGRALGPRLDLSRHQLETVVERMLALPDLSVNQKPEAWFDPERLGPPPPEVERYLQALERGNVEEARAALKAYVTPQMREQAMAEAKQGLWEQYQRLPGREHPMFGQALRHLEALGPEQGYYRDRLQREEMAGAIAFEAKRQGLSRIDGLHAEAGGYRWHAVMQEEGMPWRNREAQIDRYQMAPLLDKSLRRLAEESQRQELEQQERAQERQWAQELSQGRGRSR